MSDVSSMSAALDRMKAAMKDVIAAVDKESNNLSQGISEISNLVKRFESRVKDRSSVEEEKKKKQAQIDREIAELEKKRSLAEAAYTEQSSDSDQINKLEETKSNLASAKEDSTEASKRVAELERSINEKKREADKLRSEQQSVKKKHDSEIQSLRKSHDEAQSQFALKDAQHKAFRLLIKEKAATFPEGRIIQVLREQPNTTLEHIQDTTQLKRNDVESFVKKLAKKSIIQYDSKAGEVKVLRSLEP